MRLRFALQTQATLTLLASVPASAQTAAVPPSRVLPVTGPTTTSTGQIFSRVKDVVQLADGRLLVNDIVARRVVMLDATLAHPVPVMDSVASGPTRSYGRLAGTLLPFVADSSLFFDTASLSFVLIEPGGQVGRVMASPIPANLVSAIINSNYSTAVYAPNRGLMYTGLRSVPPTTPTMPGVMVANDDSSAVLVAHFDGRALDTVTAIKRFEHLARLNGPGSISHFDPLFQTLDEWSGFADGTIGVIRGRDFHLELYLADGSRKTFPKISFEWKALSDNEKQRIADSINTADQKDYETRLAASRGAAAPSGGGRGSDGGGSAAGGSAAAGDAGAGGRGGRGGSNTPSPPQPFEMSTLPDYLPVFARGAVRGDLDGNFWIHLGPPAGINDYMVLSRAGVPVDRITIPAGANLLGFGPNGIVYLTMSDGATMSVVRTHWK